MGCDVYQSKTVKTRKPHGCFYCGSYIPEGSHALFEHGILDGPFSRYACERCSPFVGEFWDWCGGGCVFVLDGFRDFMSERERDVLMSKTVKDLRKLARDEGITLGYAAKTKESTVDEIMMWRGLRREQKEEGS